MIIIFLTFHKYKRASLACAALLANTVSVGGALQAPGLILINLKRDNISMSVLLLKSISLEKSSNLLTCQFLMLMMTS